MSFKIQRVKINFFKIFCPFKQLIFLFGNSKLVDTCNQLGLGWGWNGIGVSQSVTVGIYFEILHEEGGKGDHIPWFSKILLDSKRPLND